MISKVATSVGSELVAYGLLAVYIVSGHMRYGLLTTLIFLVARALTGAGVPLIMLCRLALRSRKTGKAAGDKSEHTPSNDVGNASVLGRGQPP